MFLEYHALFPLDVTLQRQYQKGSPGQSGSEGVIVCTDNAGQEQHGHHPSRLWHGHDSKLSQDSQWQLSGGGAVADGSAFQSRLRRDAADGSASKFRLKIQQRALAAPPA